MFDSVFFECSRQPNILSCFFLSFNLKVFCVNFNAKVISLVLHNLIFRIEWTMGFHLKISEKLWIGFYLAWVCFLLVLVTNIKKGNIIKCLNSSKGMLT